jgi:carboxymethylenebutenolidase
LCFDDDSHPPIDPSAGAAVEHEVLELRAADGSRLAAFHALAERPSGIGMLVLPDVRGLFPYYEELALRFAELGVDALAIDYYGRTAGPERRDARFEPGPHTKRCTWDGLRADVLAGATTIREAGRVRSLYSIGFCLGGRISFLLSSVPELDLAGVVGFYGWPKGDFGSAGPAPTEVAAQMSAPVLGLFGGADPRITDGDVATFEQALAAAGVEHRIVTYEGAPHSFFDRKQEEFGEASASAWAEVLAFIGLQAAQAPFSRSSS